MALRTIYPQKHYLTANGTVGGVVAIADVTQLAIGTVGVIYDINNDPVSIAVMGIDTLNSTLTLYANGSPLDASPFTRAGLATVNFPYQMVDGSGFIPAPPPASDVLNGIVRLNRAAPVPATPVVPVFDAGGRLGGVADPVAVDDVATMGWVTGVLPAPYTLPIASGLVLGGIKVGSGLSIDVDGLLATTYSYTLPIASALSLGGIKVGSNLSIDVDGVLAATYSYTLPIASALSLGGIKVGAHLTIDVDGVLSAEGGITAPYTLAGVGDTVPFTINGIVGQTANLQSWQVDSVEKAYVDKDGGASFGSFVGINTTSPTYQLEVVDESLVINRGIAISQHNTGVNGASFSWIKSRGTRASPTAVANGDYGGFIVNNFYDGGAYRPTAGFGFRINGTVASNSVPTDLFFYTNTTTTGDPYNNGTVRMIIDSAGKVGIGIQPTTGLHLYTTLVNGNTALRVNTSTTWTSGNLIDAQNNGSARFVVSATGLTTITGSLTSKALEILGSGSGIAAITIPYQSIIDFGNGNNLKAATVDYLEMSKGLGVVSFVGTPKVQGYGPITLTLMGRMVNGASAVSVVVDSETAYSTVGAKLLSVQNAGVEKFYIDKDGEAWANGVHLGAGGGGGIVAPYTLNGVGDTIPLTINGIVGQTAKLQSWQVNGVEKAYVAADGGIACTFSSVNGTIRSYGTAAAIQLGRFGVVCNPTLQIGLDAGNGYQASIINTWGNSSNPGILVGTNRADGTAFQVGTSIGVDANTIASNSGTTRFIVLGSGYVGAGFASPTCTFHVSSPTADGGTAATIASSSTWSNAASKLLTLYSGTTERFVVNGPGRIYSTCSSAGDITNSGGANTLQTWNNPAAGGQSSLMILTTGNPTAKLRADYMGNFYVIGYAGSVNIMTGGDSGAGTVRLSLPTTGGASLIGTVTDSATAVGVGLNNTVALTVAGAKLLSIANAGVEKAYVDKDGGATFWGPLGVGVASESGSRLYLSGDNHTVARIEGTYSGRVRMGATGATSNTRNFEFSSRPDDIGLPGSFRISSLNDGWSLYVNQYILNAAPSGAISFNSAVTSLAGYNFVSPMANGASAIGMVVDTAVAYTTTAKILSVRNFGTEKFYVSNDGGVFSQASITANNHVISGATGNIYSGAGAFVANSAVSADIRGNIANGASAVGIILNNITSLTTAGAKLLSVRNAGVEKAYVDWDGYISVSGTFIRSPSVNGTSRAYPSGTQTNTNQIFEFYSNSDLANSPYFYMGVSNGSGWSSPLACSIIASTKNGTSTSARDLHIWATNSLSVSNMSLTLKANTNLVGVNNPAPIAALDVKSLTADGATAIVLRVDTSTAWANASAKLFSINNNGSEKVWFDVTGSMNTSSTIKMAATKAIYFTSALTSAIWADASAIVNVRGAPPDGASAVGVVVDSDTALTIAGAKLLSVRNAGVEKAYVDKDGYITSAGSPVSRKVAVPATAASAGIVGDWAADASWLYICTATDTWERTAITLATW